MAIQVVLAVFDVALKAYGRPFVAPTVPAAERAVADEVNTAGTPLNKFPQDFRLFVVGHFDDETGKLDPLVSPDLVANCTSYVKGA